MPNRFLGTDLAKAAAGKAAADRKRQRNPFTSEHAVASASLDDYRGGFVTDNGLAVTLGIERIVTINGNIAERSDLNFGDLGNLTSGQPAMLLGDDLTEAELVSAQMRGSWTEFVTRGNPGWPAYERDRRLTRVFDTAPTVAAYPEEVSRRIWQDHVFSALPLLS